MASVVAAVEQAIKHNAGTLTINTDSQYLINYSKIIETWKKNGWKRRKEMKTNKDPKNMKHLKTKF